MIKIALVAIKSILAKMLTFRVGKRDRKEESH